MEMEMHEDGHATQLTMVCAIPSPQHCLNTRQHCLNTQEAKPEGSNMPWSILAVVHDIELDSILRLPLNIAEEALVDQHLQWAQHAGHDDQNEVVLCGSKTAKPLRVVSAT